MRRDLSEAFSLPLWLYALHLQTTTFTCQAGASPRSLVDQARAHIGNAREAIFTRSSSDPFVPGWPSTSEYPTGKSPVATLNSYSQATNSTQVFDYNLVEFNI